MIVELEYQDKDGQKVEAVKKIPDMKQEDVEKYIKSMDCQVRKITNIKIKGDRK